MRAPATNSGGGSVIAVRLDVTLYAEDDDEADRMLKAFRTSAHEAYPVVIVEKSRDLLEGGAP